MTNLNLRQCLRIDLRYVHHAKDSFCKLYMTPSNLYPILKEEVYRIAESRTVVELDNEMLDPKEGVEVFKEAGRAGDILIVKAPQDLGVIAYLIYVWYVSGGRYLDGKGELVREDGTTNGSDWSREGFAIIVWTTPKVYQKIDELTKREIFPPKNCYHFLSEDQRDWEIFKK